MRLKTLKIDYMIFNKLKEIDTDINTSLRKLFYTLQNEAEKLGAEQVLENNNKMIKENTTKIEELPHQKEKFEKDFQTKYEHQMRVLENRKKIIQAKINSPEIITPSRKWENDPQWVNLSREEMELSLLSVDNDLESLERQKEVVLEEENQAENYEVLKVRLEQQNERLKMENERFKRIIEMCDQLNIEVKEAQKPTYVG